MTEEEQAFAAFNWFVHTYAPSFLRLAKLDDHARAFEGLPKITRREQSADVFTQSRRALEETNKRRFPGLREPIWRIVSQTIGGASFPTARNAAFDVLGVASTISEIADDAAKIAVAIGSATTEQVRAKESELEQQLSGLLSRAE